jgi:hypothetical protein
MVHLRRDNIRKNRKHNHTFVLRRSNLLSNVRFDLHMPTRLKVEIVMTISDVIDEICSFCLMATASAS